MTTFDGLHELINSFVDGRLMVNDNGTLRIAHESLLRHWKPASQVLDALADAELRKSRVRAAAAIAAAFIFFLIAMTAGVLYYQSDRNLLLASRARADRFIVDRMPTKALLLASNSTSSLLTRALQWLEIQNDETIRLQSIAKVAGGAALTPKTVYSNASAANSVDVSSDGQVTAIGYETGDVELVGPTFRTTLTLSKGPILKVRFDPTSNGVIIATGRGIYLWVKQGDSVTEICTTGTEITDLDVNYASRRLAWSAKDKSVTVIDLSMALCLQGKYVLVIYLLRTYSVVT